MNITLTITASEPVLAFMKALTGGIPAAQPAPAAKAKAKEIAPPVESTAAIETPAADPGPVTVTLEQLRALSQLQSQSGKRDGVKGLLAKFGVDKITSLTADQYAAFYAEMQAL